MRSLILLIALLPSGFLGIHAQELVRTHSWMVGGGPTEILDTYLSPEHFKGGGFCILSTSERRREGRHWSTMMEHQTQLALADDRREQYSEMAAHYQLLWGRWRQWQLPHLHLTLQAGGMAAAHLGFIYNTHQGNNPAQAQVALHLMPAAAATWAFRLLKRQARLRYECQLPLAGVMFSPHFGQSYYEIFSRGNYDHNVVPTTFLSAPNFRQLLSCDLQLSRRFTLRLGYLGDFQQSHVNDIKQHVYAHQLMVGFVKSFTIHPHD